MATVVIPSPVGMTEDEYEFQVMDMYINAKRGNFVVEKFVTNISAMLKVRIVSSASILYNPE